MSDLISRSKLIENFRKCYSGHLGMENSDACMTFHGICNVINNTNTAYSVDKVVTELNELDVKAIKRYKGGTFGDYEGTDYYIEKSKAIEIVKQGCVDVDVCEWEKGSSGYVGYPAYYSKCCTTNSKGLEMQAHIIANWKYCPYCGKKIKIVGD